MQDRPLRQIMLLQRYSNNLLLSVSMCICETVCVEAAPWNNNAMHDVKDDGWGFGLNDKCFDHCQYAGVSFCYLHVCLTSVLVTASMLACPFATMHNDGHGELHWYQPEPDQVR